MLIAALSQRAQGSSPARAPPQVRVGKLPALKDVSRAPPRAGLHERLRGVIGLSQLHIPANAVVTLKLDTDTYSLTDEQVALLIYKLSGMASGAFPREIDYLGAGTAWLPAASELADSLYLATHDSVDRSIQLDHTTGIALYQVLRVTYTGRSPNTLSRLHASLEKMYH